MERPIVLEVTYKVSNTSLPGKVRAILNRDITPIYYGEVQYIYTYFLSHLPRTFFKFANISIFKRKSKQNFLKSCRVLMCFTNFKMF